MQVQDDLDAYHYPTDLLQLLRDTLAHLCRGRRDVLTFFRSCAVPSEFYSDLASRLDAGEEPAKAVMAGQVLNAINEAGPRLLRARREVVRRIVQTEDFSTCWPDDRLKARGLVAQVRERVNQQDAFTRMAQERDTESRRHRLERQAQLDACAARGRARSEIARRIGVLAKESNPQRRGKALEPILNDYFALEEIAVRDAFIYRSEDDSGQALEQIDGVIALDGQHYLVEMKWWAQPLGPGDLAWHMIRAGHRAGARGVVISASGYTDAAVTMCKDELSRGVFVLAELRELLLCSEQNRDLTALLRAKVEAAIVDRRPLYVVA